jgi:hypothetical protein
MKRLPAPCILAVLAAACVARPNDARPSLMDVSGDDCTASVLVYDRPPSTPAAADSGVAFINDGCAGDRVFLGIDGARRELKRAQELPLGSGGAYSDGDLRVLVKRGRMAFRTLAHAPPDADCADPLHREYEAAYEARVQIGSGSRSWSIDGTLRQSECAP